MELIVYGSYQLDLHTGSLQTHRSRHTPLGIHSNLAGELNKEITTVYCQNACAILAN